MQALEPQQDLDEWIEEENQLDEEYAEWLRSQIENPKPLERYEEDALLEYDLRIQKKELEDALENKKSNWPSKMNSSLTVWELEDAINMARIALGSPHAARVMMENGSIKTLGDLYEGLYIEPPSESASESNDDDYIPTFDEWMVDADEELEWLVNDLFLAGGSSLIVSSPKAGKSTFVSNLIYSVSRGDKFLGKDTKKCSGILLYTVDETKQIGQARFQKMGSQFPGLRVVSDPLSVGDAKKIKRQIERFSPGLIVFDTIEKCLKPDDSNSYSEVVKKLGELISFANGKGAHVLLIHHTNKRTDGTDLTKIMGSQGFAASVDTVFSLTGSGNSSRRLRTIGARAGEPIDVRLKLNDKDSRLHAISGILDTDDAIEIEGLIFDFLSEQCAPVKRDDVISAVGMDRNKVIAALNTMTESEKLLRTGKGKKGDPHMFSVFNTE